MSPCSIAASVPPAASIRSSIATRLPLDAIGRRLDGPGAGERIDACWRRPLSCAMICCVRSAMRADSSVGSASASSRPLQWSDCVPPSTAASAWMRDADDVVVGLLRGERAAGGLRVEAQLLRARIGRAEALAHDPRPQPARRAELRDLLEKIVVRVEEEREPLAEAC